MAIIRVGERDLNVSFLIMAEPTPDGLGKRVTMMNGKEIELTAAEAAELDAALSELRKWAATPQEGRVNRASNLNDRPDLTVRAGEA